MTSKKDSTGRAGLVVRAGSFLLPLVLVGAYLNMGQSSCGGDNTLKCQGKSVTHTFATSAIATNGDDVILVTAGHVNIFASGGDDTVCVITSQPGVTIYAGPDNDVVHAGAGGNILRGEGGDDTLVGGAGVDMIYGGEGADILEGGDNIDYLLGGAGNDELIGGAGDDWLSGDDGDDLVYGEAGNDELWGGTGIDDLVGGEGNDTLKAGDESDALNGGPGSDIGYPCSRGTVIFQVESIEYDDHCPMESEDVLSARLEVSMCNFLVGGAEHYQSFKISLNDQEPEMNFHGAYPASPRFPSGSTHVYDFLVSGELRDINELSIRSPATNDPFCLARVRLGVNHLTEGTTTRKWLFDTGPIETQVGAGGTLTYSFSDLRSALDWKWSNFMPLLDPEIALGNDILVVQHILSNSSPSIVSTGLDYETLERLLEGLIDQALQGQAVEWDDPGLGGELVSAVQGYGDGVGASTADACNAETNPLVCELDWSDPDEVCNAYPDNMWCTTDCNAYPDAWVCTWDWEALGLPASPCVWRSGVCQFPPHADIHLDLEKHGHYPFQDVDVSFLLKVSCSDAENQLKIEPDKFSVSLGGIFGGRVWERRIGNALAGVAGDFSQTVDLPDGSCDDLDPHFDACGLWLGVARIPRPNPSGPCR